MWTWVLGLRLERGLGQGSGLGSNRTCAAFVQTVIKRSWWIQPEESEQLHLHRNVASPLSVHALLLLLLLLLHVRLHARVM